MLEAQASLQSGALFLTNHQTAGRGRLKGRLWQDSPGQNILMALVLSRQAQGPLPLLCALALSKTLEKLYALTPTVKWPNDVLLTGKKTSGILCQSCNGFFIAGIGINVNQTDFGSQDASATSLKIALNRHVPRENLLNAFLASLKTTMENEMWLEDLNARLQFKGEQARYSLGAGDIREEVTGAVVCVEQDGALLLQTADGPRRIYSGEAVRL